VITSDDESLANAELKRGGGEEIEFSYSSRKLFLGLPKGKDFG
jgi:hypothetical protein